MTTPATATAEPAAVESPAKLPIEVDPPAVEIPAEPQAKPSTEQILEETWLRENHLLSPDDVDRECAKSEFSSKNGIVAGFIPRRAVTVLIGDSGLGKSPLAYQIGLCVAAGIPLFPGMQTESGLVVMADFENGLIDSRNIREQMVRFLELPDVPKNFNVWSPDKENAGRINIKRIIEGAPRKVALFIIDSLRSYDPYFEGEQGIQKMQHLNDLAYAHGTAITVIHHIRKPDREHPAPALDSDDTRVMDYLKEAAGNGALITQSHTRIALSLPDGRKSHSNDAALIVRWYRKGKGEAGPLYLERVCDVDGEPLGYRPLADVKLLGHAEQAAAFHSLPEQFGFKEAKEKFGRSDDPTRKWLQKCISLGLIKQIGRGRYERATGKAGVAEIGRVGREVEKRTGAPGFSTSLYTLSTLEP
ncbi:MAG TPA: AAA family ATPase [Candidatus Solibacter sp.]|nr:AAA family ATPase [Candidatus Solibacter sp.]